MILLPTLILAAGLNTAVAPSPATAAGAALTRQAEISLNRSVAAVAPRLQRRTVEHALADSQRAFSQAFARQIATTRVSTRSAISGIHKQAKAALDHSVKIAWKKLGARAVSDALRECRHDVGRRLAVEIANLRPAREIALEPEHRDGEVISLALRR